MRMNDPGALLSSWVWGLLLGGLFFGGLWWTVRRGLASEHPALWFLGSLMLRTVLVLAGFAWIARGSFRTLPLCLLGFVMARMVVMRLSRAPEPAFLREKEASHAPWP